MIKLIRVDDSFLYGRVSVLWAEKLKASEIYIISNQMKIDDFAKMALTLACPKGVSLRFFSMEEAKEALHQAEKAQERILLVVERLGDLERLLEALPQKFLLNLGSIRNRGYLTVNKLCGYVGLSPEEDRICRRLCEKGIRIECRYIPEEKAVPYQKNNNN